MLNFDALFADLEAIGLGAWRKPLEPVLRDQLTPGRPGTHGNLPGWRDVLAQLPRCERSAQLDSPLVHAGPAAFRNDERVTIENLLMQLSPWRKGPFRVGDIVIDAEWRSDRKWARLNGALAPLEGRLVLDVGCGNGYYALRMRGAGARAVVGIDPTLLYVVQFLAIRHFMPPQPVHVLPLRLDELPRESNFDTVFSMGVLYHQRIPAQHLADLNRSLRPDGELVLETLVLPGTTLEAKTPERYARMRNVWLLPTRAQLTRWLEEAGFADIRTVDVSPTTPNEQRRTAWMPFESLSEALDPHDPGLTVEGWPAPLRALVVSRKAAPCRLTS